jgi:bacterioferritin (cytochrome b1)
MHEWHEEAHDVTYQSIDEMKHADRLIERIPFLRGCQLGTGKLLIGENEGNWPAI